MVGTGQDPNQLQKVIDVVHDGVVVIQDEDIVMINEAFSGMIGLSGDDLLDSAFEDLIDSMSRRRDKDAIKALVTGESPKRFNTRLVSKSGAVLHVEIHPEEIEFDGAPAVIAAIRDVTERIALESTVTELENRFATLYDMSPVAYFTLNRDGIIEQVNAAAEELTGCPASEMIGKSLSEFLPAPENGYDPAGDIVKEALRGKAVKNLELEMRCKDGKTIWASISSRPFTSGTDRPTEIGLTAVDVTRRRKMEQELRVESERANLYMEVMTQDLNMVNQNALFALEDISISVDLPERLKNVVSETAWSLRRAGRMIANMGVLISLDQKPPEKMRTALNPHFKKAINEAQRDFAWKSLNIKAEVGDKALEVSGHPFMWYIFFNIIHHSASSDTSNEVNIGMKARLDESGEMVRIEVVDEGPGIRDEIKADIFRREGAHLDHLQGSGLGLTVVDRYIRNLGGQIWVEDRVPGKPEKGSKFVVLLPAWKEELAIPPIVFYKSDHCIFCGPVLESLTHVLKELGISASVINLVNVDDPDSGVVEDDLPALPTIRLGSHELSGFQTEDDLRSAVSTMILMSG
ncbi:MAG: hypothetical protein DRP09_05780 [Candidatus Thorarchaeota archaeon]|nr:MAG: hypothetical protein DRP09_05780 [Candidatus Thorarchaeota archaeon]